MRSYWTTVGCDSTAERELVQQWRERQAEVDAKAELLGSSGRAHLRMFAERPQESEEWRLKAALYADQSTIAADAQGQNLVEVMDSLAARLSQRIDEIADGSDEPVARRAVTGGVLPLLEEAHRESRSREFLCFLTPVVARLGRYVRHELQLRRQRGESTAGEITARDVLDDVLLLGWERFSQRPANLPLDLWLLQLVDATLDRQARPADQQSLQDRRSDDTEPRDSVRSQWVEHATEPETIEMSRLLPSDVDTTAWDSLELEERQTHLDELLGQLPRDQRQVLMLHAVDGFSLAEVADFQSREVSEVEADLAAGRRKLAELTGERQST